MTTTTTPTTITPTARLEAAGYVSNGTGWESPYTARTLATDAATAELEIFEGLDADTAEPAFWQ